MKLAPFAIQYWNRFASKVIIYDNGSSDGSIEYFSQFPFIEIRHFVTDGLNDVVHRNIKNVCWKESSGSADFVVVCDFDEFLYSPNIFGELSYMRENGMTICKPREYCMVSDKFPEYGSEHLSHENLRGYPGASKCILFDPNKIIDMNYSYGCHSCSPTGEVKYYDGNSIFMLHHCDMTEDFVINKNKSRREHFSSDNMRMGLGTFYFKSDEQAIKDFRYKLNNSESMIKIISE